MPSRRTDQGRDCGAAEIQRIAENAPRWSDVNSRTRRGVVHSRRPPNSIMLYMDSSVSPAYGDQQGTAYNGHFACTCYHPLFVFNQFGDLERCVLRPGNVHSAHGWKDEVEPVVARYRASSRAATSVPMPTSRTRRSTSSWGPKASSMRSGCPPSDSSREDRVSAQAPCWSSSERGPAVLRQLQLSGAKLEDTAPGG